MPLTAVNVAELFGEVLHLDNIIFHAGYLTQREERNQAERGKRSGHVQQLVVGALLGGVVLVPSGAEKDDRPVETVLGL